MINTYRVLIFSCLLLTCTFLSCDKEEQESIEVQPSSSCGQTLIPFDLEQFENIVTDSTSVVGVKLEQSCLIVDFAYSGCEQREVGAMVLLDQSPFIPILNVKVQNVDPQEVCLAFFMHSDTFDLASTSLDIFSGMSVNVYEWNQTFILDLD